MPADFRPECATDEFGDAGALFDLLRRGRPAWQKDALCREYPSVNFFPGGEGLAAKRVCQRCLVERECRAWSLEQGSDLDGVWGGLTQRERNQARREKRAA